MGGEDGAMAPYDPFWGINSRFESLETRMTVLEADEQRLRSSSERQAQQMEDMIDGFRAMRLAMYSVAVIIIAAAVTIVLLGKPI
jgi:hypothetical protein